MSRAALEVQRILKSHVPVSASKLASWKLHVLMRRQWLCKLSALITEQKPDEDQKTHFDDDDFQNDADDEVKLFQAKFPSWDWHFPQTEYVWSCSRLNKPMKWHYSQEMWEKTSNFFMDLKWRIHPEAKTSIHELAFLYWLAYRLIPPMQKTAPCGPFVKLCGWIRYFISMVGVATVIPDQCSYNPKLTAKLSQTVHP